MKNLKVAIDASRNRSGGAIAHLVGILAEGDPLSHGIVEIHVWGYKKLLSKLPDHAWIVKHNPPEIERSLLQQIIWQRFMFPQEFKRAKCNIVLNADAGTVSIVHPSVTMSRDMLSYEPGEIERYGFSFARLRLILLRYIQNRSLRNSSGVIFLTRYASSKIQQYTGSLKTIAHIPHGVGNEFKQIIRANKWPESYSSPINCVYVSNTELYKHQWVVVKAISLLRKKGHNILLTLIGGGRGLAQQLLEAAITKEDPEGLFVRQMPFLTHKELSKKLAFADLGVFASSCENMPNTLIELMAIGLPIACSERGPMQEVLEDAGVYFNPEVPESIAAAIEKIIISKDLRNFLSERSKMLSQRYSWRRCSEETFAFIVQTYMKEC